MNSWMETMIPIRRLKFGLTSCAACRQELQELRRVWGMLPLVMEEVEVPADLKAEVMNAVFSHDREQGSAAVESSLPDQSGGEVGGGPAAASPGGKNRFRRRYGLAAALVPLLLASVIWNLVLLKEKAESARPDAPAQIVSIEAFEAASPAFAFSKGMVCILEQNDQRKLVVYLYNLPATRGDEAYQVWLLRDGHRGNAGTFRVGDDGFGVLVMDIRPDDRFDSVGVTLEPDAAGTQPRGSKVAGAPLSL
jgi:hypothetical protein